MSTRLGLGNQSNGPSWQSAVVAIAIVALVAFMFKEAVDHDFTTIWAAVGTVVGVVTGAIPSFFFKQQAQQAQQEATAAHEDAKVYAAAADPNVVAQLRGLS